MNDILFTKGEGGLGRPLPGEDHISGLLSFKATLPTGYAADARVKEYRSLPQAEAHGIKKGDVNWGVLWYHIKEFFRLHPKGVLWNYIAVVPAGAYTFSELVSLQNAADGKIRKMGVFVTSEAFATTHVTALQAIYAQLFNEHRPANIALAPDISATADISTLPDLRTLASPNVSVVIGQDGNNEGAGLYTSTTKSVSCLGALLGALSKSKVNECIAWVGKFPLANNELDVAAFSNGTLVKNVAAGVLDGLNTKGYIFLRKHVGLSNTYFNDSHTATVSSSDYCFIEANTTIDKATRNVRTVLLPELNAPVFVNPQTGRLTDDYVEYLKALGDTVLGQMERDGELSGYQTIIDPEQDILASGNIEISIEQVATGVSRNFNIKIGYVKQLS